MSKMAAPRSSSGSNPGSNQEISMNKSEPLIPRLPDEVAELCLLYLPYPYQALGTFFDIAPGLKNLWTGPAPQSFFDAGNINGKILAVGGGKDHYGSSITAVDCYDPKKDTWEAYAPLPGGLAKYDSNVVGNKMYVTEGWTWPFMYSPRGVVYDPDDNTWQEMRPGMRDGWTGVSVVVGGRLLVISEYGDCPMKAYDPDKDTWRYVGGDRFPCEALRRPFAASGVEGNIYVVACGLNVGVGRLSECEAELKVEWQLLPAPSAFRGFSPSSCQVLFA